MSSYAGLVDNSVQGHFSDKCAQKHALDNARQRKGSPKRKGVLHFAPNLESHPDMGNFNLNRRVLQQFTSCGFYKHYVY